ncbi:MAG: hypothetical protein Q7R76_02980 [Candidatus Woesearchaeota archaeon]|nr:hypothetical protein [Candidatus Woesearchaeota archaeon]
MRKSLCAVLSALALQFSLPARADEPSPPTTPPAAAKKEPTEVGEPNYTKSYLSSCDTQWLVGRTYRDGVSYPTINYLNFHCKSGFRFHQQTEHHANRSLSITDSITVSGSGDTSRFLAEYERRTFTVGHAWEHIGVKAQVAWLFGVLIAVERITPGENADRITYDISPDFQIGAAPTLSADYSFGSFAVGLTLGAGYIKEDVFGFADGVFKPDESWFSRLTDSDTFVRQWNAYASLSFPGWK